MRTKLQNSNYDYNQKLKLWKNSKTSIGTKLEKISSDKTKTKVLTKLKKIKSEKKTIYEQKSFG